MSLLPSCTCRSIGMGLWSEECPRHGSSARWYRQEQERRAAERVEHHKALRQQALTRPVHGGYPDGGVPDRYSGPAPAIRRPSKEWYAAMIDATEGHNELIGPPPIDGVATGSPGNVATVENARHTACPMSPSKRHGWRTDGVDGVRCYHCGAFRDSHPYGVDSSAKGGA